MSFPTTGILDDFNRADSATLGANWTTGPTTRSHQIISNTVGAHASGNSDSYWNVATFQDAEAYVTLVTHPGSSFFTLNVRYATAGNNYYELFINMTPSPDTWTINRVDGGVPTQLGATISQNIATGEKFGLEIIGSTISVYHYTGGAWGAALGTRSDATYSAAGYLKWFIGSTTWRLDDFGGGTVVAAGRTTKNTRSNPLGVEVGMGWRMPA